MKIFNRFRTNRPLNKAKLRLFLAAGALSVLILAGGVLFWAARDTERSFDDGSEASVNCSELTPTRFSIGEELPKNFKLDKTLYDSCRSENTNSATQRLECPEGSGPSDGMCKCNYTQTGGPVKFPSSSALPEVCQPIAIEDGQDSDNSNPGISSLPRSGLSGATTPNGGVAPDIEDNQSGDTADPTTCLLNLATHSRADRLQVGEKSCGGSNSSKVLTCLSDGQIDEENCATGEMCQDFNGSVSCVSVDQVSRDDIASAAADADQVQCKEGSGRDTRFSNPGDSYCVGTDGTSPSYKTCTDSGTLRTQTCSEGKVCFESTGEVVCGEPIRETAISTRFTQKEAATPIDATASAAAEDIEESANDSTDLSAGQQVYCFSTENNCELIETTLEECRQQFGFHTTITDNFGQLAAQNQCKESIDNSQNFFQNIFTGVRNFFGGSNQQEAQEVSSGSEAENSTPQNQVVDFLLLPFRLIGNLFGGVEQDQNSQTEVDTSAQSCDQLLGYYQNKQQCEGEKNADCGIVREGKYTGCYSTPNNPNITQDEENAVETNTQDRVNQDGILCFSAQNNCQPEYIPDIDSSCTQGFAFRKVFEGDKITDLLDSNQEVQQLQRRCFDTYPIGAAAPPQSSAALICYAPSNNCQRLEVENNNECADIGGYGVTPTDQLMNQESQFSCESQLVAEFATQNQGFFENLLDTFGNIFGGIFNAAESQSQPVVFAGLCFQPADGDCSIKSITNSSDCTSGFIAETTNDQTQNEINFQQARTACEASIPKTFAEDGDICFEPEQNCTPRVVYSGSVDTCGSRYKVGFLKGDFESSVYGSVQFNQALEQCQFSNTFETEFPGEICYRPETNCRADFVYTQRGDKPCNSQFQVSFDKGVPIAKLLSDEAVIPARQSCLEATSN